MERHVVRIEDGTCLIEGDADPVRIGTLEAVVEALGGAEYVLEYDEKAANTPWVSTDNDGTLTLEVREAIDEFPLPPAVYEDLSDLGPSADEAATERVTYFVGVLTAIWDAKGGIEPSDLAEAGQESLE